MAHDLIVRGGLVVDGSGGPPRRADVGLRDGLVVEVAPGLSGAPAIDAEGAIVTPGFVDIHTHYDGQASWDEELAPSSMHGVTTVVMGNCGVGFAPVKPSDRETLVRLMEGVEDIPGSALSEGISWRWSSFPSYLDALDEMPHALDICAQVPHDALRVYAMGARGVEGEPATDDDVAAMRALLREALAAGAAGFSTGRTDNHRSADGRDTPACDASAAELAGIARAFEGIDHGVLQMVSDFDMAAGPERFDAEFGVLESMMKAADGHRGSLSLMQRDQAPGQWLRILERIERAASAGIPMFAQVAPRPIGVLLGLEATFHPFVGFPSYQAIAQLPLDERLRRMREPAFRARLLQEKSEPLAGDGSPIPPLADQLLARIDMVALRLFRIGERPCYEPTVEDSLYAEAQAAGRPVLEVLYDVMLEQDGRELLYFPLYNYTEMNLDNVARMLKHPRALAGLSDGGAHVGTVCDASFPSFLLAYWTRDRAGDRIHLEQAVKMQTRDTAGHMGLFDRGLVAPGMRADLNVIDMDRLALRRPRLVADLPAGGKRLLQDAVGYRATLVGGVPIVTDDRATGATPGRLVRPNRQARRRPSQVLG